MSSLSKQCSLNCLITMIFLEKYGQSMNLNVKHKMNKRLKLKDTTSEHKA